MAIFGLVSQFCVSAPSPIAVSVRLMSPDGCIMERNTSPTATLFSTAGRKKTVRI